MKRFLLTNSCDSDHLWQSPHTKDQSNTSFPLPRNSSVNITFKSNSQLSDLQAKTLISLYVLIIIYIIGVVGNSLSLMVLMRKKMARISTYIYLAALSVLDTVVLTTGLLQMWLEELGFVSFRIHSNPGCKMTKVINYVVSDSSVWLIIAVTVERFIAVCHPLKAASICRRKTAVKIIIFIFIFFCLFNSHFLLTTQLFVSSMQQ